MKVWKTHLTLYGVDASSTLGKAFQQNFPNTPIACESIEDSLFFNRKFGGIIAWGLIFLISLIEEFEGEGENYYLNAVKI